MRIQFTADDVRLDVSRSADGKPLPSVAAARNGTVLIELTKAELQGLLMAFAQAALDEHGGKIESADLDLSSAGDRAVRASLRVKASKMLVSAIVTLEARAEVDEHLAVKLSNLRAVGDGLVGSAVAGMLRARLGDYEGRTFDLAPGVLDNIKLSTCKIEVEDPVRISARFEA